MEKMTKKEMFGYIASAMAENEDVVAFCQHEIELLEKKSSKSGQTKVQKENEVLMVSIVNALAIIGRPVTISELQREDAMMSEYQNQKLSALLKKLVESGKVVRTVDKKKAYFSVPTDEDSQYLDREVEAQPQLSQKKTS